jgi:hypothetical protein
MNTTEIFQIIAQGLALLPSLIEAGVDVVDRIKQMEAVSTAAAAGTLTSDQVAAYRAQLDQDLADFNQPMT